MKIKLNTGLDVRTGPDNEDGSVPTRRIGEAGDVTDISVIPEWNGEVPAWLVEHGHVEIIDDNSAPNDEQVVIVEDKE